VSVESALPGPGGDDLCHDPDPSVRKRFYDAIDPSRKFYAYERMPDEYGFDSSSEPRHKAWPVAYARELGYGNSLKHTRDYFVDEGPQGEYIQYFPDTQRPEWYWNRSGKFEAFYCPSDKLLIRDSWSPCHDIGVMSYAVNADIFGENEKHKHDPKWDVSYTPYAVAYGAPGNLKERLRGRLDAIVRPSEVAMLTDMGHDEAEMVMDTRNTGDAISSMILTYDSFHSGGETMPVRNASYLDGAARWVEQVFPISRHGAGGGMNVAFADGHAGFIRGSGGFVQLDNRQRFRGNVGDQCLDRGNPIRIVRTYIPRPPRVTPYNPLPRVNP